MADSDTPALTELVGGPLDGRVQVIRAPRFLAPVTDSSVRYFLEHADPQTSPPTWQYAVYEVEAPSLLADERMTRYTFRGFE